MWDKLRLEKKHKVCMSQDQVSFSFSRVSHPKYLYFSLLTWKRQKYFLYEIINRFKKGKKI